MSLGTNTVCHVAFVVRDIDKTMENWAKLLEQPKARVWNIPPASEVPAYTDGHMRDHSDCRISILEFDNLILEFVEPGETPSPFLSHLEKHGEGFQSLSFVVKDRSAVYSRLQSLGAPSPYHVGYYPGGAYSFVDTLAQLGLEINIKDEFDYTSKIKELLASPNAPLTSDKV